MGLCNLCPRDHIFHQAWPGSQLLTMSSCDPGCFTSSTSVTAWEQLPEETYGTPGTVPLWHTPETRRPGLGRCIRCTTHLRECAHQAPGYLKAWTWGGHKTHSPLGLCPCGALENLSDLDLGSSQNAGATWDNTLAGCLGAWAVWTLEVHTALGCGKPSVVHPPQALSTHARSICL